MQRLKRWIGRHIRKTVNCVYCQKQIGVLWRWQKFRPENYKCSCKPTARQLQEAERKDTKEGRLRNRGHRITRTAVKCLVCGRPLYRTNRRQIVYYCSPRKCRKLRHNKRKGLQYVRSAN